MKRIFFARLLLSIGIAASILSSGYFVYRFSDDNFRDAAMGNLFATIMGVGLGIPAALWIDRELEKTRKESQNDEQQTQISGILERVLLQVVNAEQQIRFLQQIQFDKDKVSYHQLSQVDVISPLHGVLTNLEANTEMLLALDIVIADLRSINVFLNTLQLRILKNKEMPSLRSFPPSDIDSELGSRISFALESIKTFRGKVQMKYPLFWKTIKENK